MSSHNHSAAEVTCSDVAYELAHSPTATPSAGNLNVHLIDQFESRDPAILKAGLLFAAAILSVIGNGTSLAVIWKTPKLHTKTFALLFNVAAVDLFAGLVLIWKGVYNIVVYVLNDDPCKYLIVVAIVAFAARYPVYLSMCSVGLIAYERYIAVVRPLRYETLVTDKTIKVAVAFVWITCLPLTGTFLILLGRIDWATCTLSGLVRQALITDATCLITIFTVIAGLHGHMLIIALQQQAKISAEAAEIQTAATATHRKLRTELKAVRLTACVVGAVVVLWTPYLVGNLILIGGINPILGQYVTDIGTALGSATSSINWIIYGLASRDFRHSALRLFRYHRQTVDSGTNDSNINADIVTPDITLSRVSKDRVTPSHPITLSSDARLEASNSMMSHV